MPLYLSNAQYIQRARIVHQQNILALMLVTLRYAQFNDNEIRRQQEKPTRTHNFKR